MKVKLTVLQSSCRSGYHKNGDVYIVDDICPPICIELWNCLYPYLFAIKNGAELDAGEKKAKCELLDKHDLAIFKDGVTL